MPCDGTGELSWLLAFAAPCRLYRVLELPIFRKAVSSSLGFWRRCTSCWDRGLVLGEIVEGEKPRTKVVVQPSDWNVANAPFITHASWSAYPRQHESISQPAFTWPKRLLAQSSHVNNIPSGAGVAARWRVSATVDARGLPVHYDTQQNPVIGRQRRDTLVAATAAMTTWARCFLAGNHLGSSAYICAVHHGSYSSNGR